MNSIPKFRFIKSILIGDILFNIKWDKEEYGGHVTYGNKEGVPEIMIGIAGLKKAPLMTFSVLIHELTEALHMEHSTRFKPEHCRTEYQFHYSHREHDVICNALAGILTQFLKFDA